jgi:hypothetical protein
MASDRYRRLQKLMHHIANEQHGWLSEKGLATLLPQLIDDDSDNLGNDYADCEGLPGLAGLLYYRPLQSECSMCD